MVTVGKVYDHEGMGRYVDQESQETVDISGSFCEHERLSRGVASWRVPPRVWGESAQALSRQFPSVENMEVDFYRAVG